MILDLHGVVHADVADSVKNYVLVNQQDVPLTIITGNSDKMIRLVENALKDTGVESFETYLACVVVRKV